MRRNHAVGGWLAAGVLLLCTIGCGKGKISGTVTNSAGTKLSGATVKADPAGKTATTSSDGKYALEDVDKGNQAVTASASGYNSQSKSVEIKGTFKGDEATLDFSLGSGYGATHGLAGTTWNFTNTGTQSDGKTDNGTGTFTFTSDAGGTLTHMPTTGVGTNNRSFTATLTHPADTSGEHTDNITITVPEDCDTVTVTGTRKGSAMSGTYSSVLISPKPSTCPDTNPTTVSGNWSATQK